MHRMLPTVLVLLAIGARGFADDPMPTELEAVPPGTPPVLYEDQSWTHIGDGNFSPQSDGFSDLTTESDGTALEFEVRLTLERRAAIAEQRWKSAVLTGSVIGNDTGQFGETTPTIVELDGKEIGRITKSGQFRIAFDKSRLAAKPGKPLRFRIASGVNSGNDVDDQELGTFRLVLSPDAPPKPPAETTEANENDDDAAGDDDRTVD